MMHGDESSNEQWLQCGRGPGDGRRGNDDRTFVRGSAVDPGTDAGAQRAAGNVAEDESGDVVFVLLDMTLDNLGGFAVGGAPFLAGAAEEFGLKLRRNVVDENCLLARIGWFGRGHGLNTLLISERPRAISRMLAPGGILGEITFLF